MGSFDYGHWTSPKLACFKCRKSFKAVPPCCPNCGGQLHSMGTHFKAPKRSDIAAWKIVEQLYAAGIRFEPQQIRSFGWTQMYADHSLFFTRFDLWRMLAENGIAFQDPHVDPVQWNWNINRIQFPGERPRKAHQVQPYVEEWRRKLAFHVALIYEVCEKLDWPKPPVDSELMQQIQPILQERAESGFLETPHMDDEKSILIRLLEDERDQKA